MSSPSRALVIVSGGAAHSPFTTPDAACRGGLPAGTTDTFLREGLLAAGHEVFTAPAHVGAGQALADEAEPGFSAPPEVLPAEVTINSAGTIDGAGHHLAGFLALLSQRYGYTSFDLVAHSMGGLFSRAALRVLRDTASPLCVRSLTSIGTPWTGSFAAEVEAGQRDPADLAGDPRFAAVLAGFSAEAASAPRDGAAEQVTSGYLTGADGWNARQAGLLDGLTVTLVGGAAFTADGPPSAWPNDGLVSLRSALAQDVPASVLPHRVTHTFDDVHSLFFAGQFGVPVERALTWDPAVLAVVADAVAREV